MAASALKQFYYQRALAEAARFAKRGHLRNNLRLVMLKRHMHAQSARNYATPARRHVSPGRSFLLSACLFCCLFLLGGCGLLAKNTDTGAAGADAAPGHDESVWKGDPTPYTVDIEVDGPDYLKGRMRDLSQLEQLKKELPDSVLALERRAMQDRETAVRLLHSQCFYDGTASYSLDESAKPVRVTLRLVAGPRFSVGRASVRYEPEPFIPDEFRNRTRETGFWGLEVEHLPPPAFPDSVPGVEPGKPVVADDMLKAVEAIPASLRNCGYPLARVADSVYTLDRPKRLLNADITVDPGPAAMMGDIEVKGDNNVNPAYLRRLLPWRPGREPWDDSLLQGYANDLRGLGLFRSVEAKPYFDGMKGLEEGGRQRAVAVVPTEISVTKGFQRSLSASARYDTDTGFGVEGIWEHRNLFGNGERLKLDAPISQQQSGLKAHFEKPAFLDREQRLLFDGAALWENTDAYEQQIVQGELGIDRRLARQWWGGLSIFAAEGYLKDNEHERRDYGVLSPRAGLRYDGRNNKLNPSSGALVELKLKPFAGYYEEEFHALAGTLSAAAWYAPLGRRNDGAIDDTIVLAGRVEGGAMPASSSLASIPANLRYFTGGAGSVRGYTYQSIGPRDDDGDPSGGRSYQVVNLEARFMVAENFGIVPFLDGGMVYRDEFPRVFGDMDWGTGLGFRYYTPIGPVRLDIATPLHRIDDDPPVQFYISIGQSF